jgi:hypothetical protein
MHDEGLMLSESTRRGVGIAVVIIVIAAETIGVATGRLKLDGVLGSIVGIVTVALIIRMARGPKRV